MNTNLQPNSNIPGQEETQETQEKVHTSQGLVMTGNKAEEFRKMALKVVEGNNEVIKILDEIERKREEELKTKNTNNKLSLDQICNEIEKELAGSVGGTIYELLDNIFHSQDINSRDNNGKNALFYAIREGKIDLIELLLENGTNVDYTYLEDGIETGNPVYFITQISGDSMDSLNYLLDNVNISFSINNLEGRNLLIYLIEKIRLPHFLSFSYKDILLPLINKIVDKMRERNIDINQKDKHGYSAIMYAYKVSDNHLIDLLSKNGAKLSIINKAKVMLKKFNINKLFTN